MRFLWLHKQAHQFAARAARRKRLEFEATEKREEKQARFYKQRMQKELERNGHLLGSHDSDDPEGKDWKHT